MDPAHDLAAALHEVSNALTVVLGWAAAARRAEDVEQARGALDVVLARASQARDIARRAIGASAEPQAASSLASLVADAALGLSMEAKRADVAIEVHVEPGARGAEVGAGPSLLQVLTNLLLNAISFSPAGSTVHVSVSAAAGGRATIFVDDAGPGIAPEIRERLFEGGVTSRRGGAGIGLRHSAALAARAGGALRLGHVERGTRFEVVWPLLDEASSCASGAVESAADVSEARGSIDGSRILVVEDDEAVTELLELALEARGAQVVSVKERAGLGVALATGRFDAALLDLSPLLGDLEGAVGDLLRASPRARVVVMSGSVPDGNVGGAVMWVRKPFEVHEIIDALSPGR